MIFDTKTYADSLKDMIGIELREEERRCFSMLEFDMRRREMEPRCGDRPWHRMACESAERLGLVRWEMESRGMEPSRFGCERTYEEEDRVLVAA